MPSKNGKNPEPVEEYVVPAGLGEPEPEPEKTNRQPREVPYSPVPMSWNISQGRRGEEDDLVVIIKVITPEGDKVFFLEPSFGKNLGEALIKMSEASEKGIVYSD